VSRAPLSEDERRRLLREAARNLIFLVESCPELFTYVLPISQEDIQTLHELAHDDEEEPPDAAE
jgi:hypothetical protein